VFLNIELWVYHSDWLNKRAELGPGIVFFSKNIHARVKTTNKTVFFLLAVACFLVPCVPGSHLLALGVLAEEGFA
jgi:hypothetical protein